MFRDVYPMDLVGFKLVKSGIFSNGENCLGIDMYRGMERVLWILGISGNGHNDEEKLDVLKTISTLKMQCKTLNIVLCSREEIEEKIQDIPKDIAEVEVTDHATGKKTTLSIMRILG
ncbi:MAG: hypothetical protein ACETWM_19455 [Candidatus Lokiarchaeia archaeon]